jgi:transcriptional regulator with XRE-family HTH domain/tetratricopeptide (TPR) repeat protein
MINDEPQAMTSFGAWVRQRRKTLDLTQAALAKRVGCAVVTIKKIEQDTRRPSQQLAQLLADELAIPAAQRALFVQLGRGQFVPAAKFPHDVLRPPAFLQHTPPAKQDPPFVTRNRELAQLDRELRMVLDGHGRVVFIVGEAGQGKTRLMTEFALRAQAARSELVVVYGQCSAQAGHGDPYHPFRDVLDMLAGDLADRWRAGAVTQKQVLRIWALLPLTLQALIDHGHDLIDTLIPSAPLIDRLAPYFSAPIDLLDKLQALAVSAATRSAELSPDQLLDQFAQVLRNLALHQPLLLVLDDLQWIDMASTSLLFHIGRRLPGSRVLIVGAYRPSEIALGRATTADGEIEQHPLEPVINEFKRGWGDIQVDLSRYDSAAGQAFVAELLDSEPNRLAEAFRARLFQHTKGHPLFTIELLRDLQEHGGLLRDEAGRWIEGAPDTSDPLPARVEAVVAQRLDRLPEALREILSIGSVEGEVFDAELIARILKRDERAVLRSLSRDLEQRHRLVRESGEVVIGDRRLSRFRFSHGLFQEYLYQRLGQGERRVVHRAVAEILEEWLAIDRAASGEYDTMLLHHFWHGQVWRKAAAYALRAGDRALQVYALREAIDDYTRALQALEHVADPPASLLHDAHVRWVTAAFKFRPYADQLEHLARAEQLARDLGDEARLIEALHWTANVYLARGLWTRAGPALTECLTLAEMLGRDELAIRPTYYQALMLTYADPRAALFTFDRALELARRFGDKTIEALTHGSQGQMHAQLGDFAQAQADVQQAHDCLPSVESPLTESDVDLLTAWTYLAMGDVPHGLEYGQRSVTKAIATDNMDCICAAYACVGVGQLEVQHLPKAMSAFEESIRRSAVSGAIMPKLLAQAGLAMVRFCVGDTTAVQDLEAYVTEMQVYQNAVSAATAAHWLGTCLIQSGDLTRAEYFLKIAREFYRRAGLRPYLMRTLSALAQLYEQQARQTEAQDSRDEVTALKRSLQIDRQ